MIYDVCNIWSLMVPGMTRKRRTRAALALEDTKGELEDGEKVVSGERRLHEAIEAGSWPREVTFLTCFCSLDLPVEIS